MTGFWKGGWDETGLAHWASALRGRLETPSVSLGLVFLTPDLFDRAEDILDVLRLHGRIPLLAGCSGTSLIHGNEEKEGESGLVLALYHLPGAQLKGRHITSEEVEAVEHSSEWRERMGLGERGPNGWIVFATPFDLNGERWLRQWNEAFPGIPAIGGLASGPYSPPRAQVYLDGVVHEEGLVALSVSGEIELETVVSQGCTPIGDSWTITRTDRNFILGIGNRPAYAVLVDTFNGLTQDEQVKSHNNLFIGLASDEYHEEFQAGDFLIRNLVGADPGSGVLAVGAQPRTGQTIQFHRRDAQAAGEELAHLLARARERVQGRPVYGGCLCLCNGRGVRMFGRPNHDAALIQEQLGPLPLVGFFGNGELGPIGSRNFLHGYTASLGVFVGKPVTKEATTTEEQEPPVGT